MNINGKHYVKCEAEIYSVPDEAAQAVKLENGMIWTIVIQGNARIWVRADTLKSRQEAERNLVDRLMGELGWLVNNKAAISKAEAKRRLISAGVISK